MKEQTEALRLVNSRHNAHLLTWQANACAELLRLHAENQALRQALAEAALDKMADNAKELGLSYEPAPPECKTEAEKTAYAFGWYKALESVRQQPAPAQEPDPDALTAAYMSGVYEGKKRKPWVGLTDEERSYYLQSATNVGWWQASLFMEAKLKEKNT